MRVAEGDGAEQGTGAAAALDPAAPSPDLALAAELGERLAVAGWWVAGGGDGQGRERGEAASTGGWVFLFLFFLPLRVRERRVLAVAIFW